jgi:hypothetical protein
LCMLCMFKAMCVWGSCTDRPPLHRPPPNPDSFPPTAMGMPFPPQHHPPHTATHSYRPIPGSPKPQTSSPSLPSLTPQVPSHPLPAMHPATHLKALDLLPNGLLYTVWHLPLLLLLVLLLLVVLLLLLLLLPAHGCCSAHRQLNLPVLLLLLLLEWGVALPPCCLHTPKYATLHYWCPHACWHRARPPCCCYCWRGRCAAGRLPRVYGQVTLQQPHAAAHRRQHRLALLLLLGLVVVQLAGTTQCCCCCCGWWCC